MATAAAPEDIAPFNLYNHLVSMNVQFKYTIDAFKRVHLLIGHGGLEFVAKPSKTQLTKQRHQSTLWKYAENWVRSNLHQLLPTAQHHIWVVCPSTPNNNQDDKLVLRLNLLREENALSPMGYLFTCPPNQLIMGISDGLLMAFGNYLRVDVSEFGMFRNWYAAISPAILTGLRSETSWAVEDNTGIANGFACVVDNTLGYVVNIRDGGSLMEAIEDCFRTLADDFRFPSHIESDEAGNCVKIVMPLTGSLGATITFTRSNDPFESFESIASTRERQTSMYQAFQGDHPQAFLPISVLKFIFFVSKVSDVDMGAVFRMVESVVLRACHNVRNSGILHVGPMELLAYCLKLLSLMDTHGYGKETGFSTKETRDIIVETSSEILSMIWRPVTWRILETEAATQTELSVLRSMLFPSLAFSHPLLCWPIGNLGCNQACMEYRDNRKFEMRLTLAIRPAHAAPVWRITQGFMMMRVFESRKFGEISSTALKGIGMAVAEDLGCVCYNSDDVHGGSNDHQGFVLVVSSKLALKYMINSVG